MRHTRPDRPRSALSPTRSPTDMSTLAIARSERAVLDTGGAMPRRASTLVFDEFVVGTTAVYTSPEFNDELGRYERLAIQAITDQVTGTTPTILVQQEHASDQ